MDTKCIKPKQQREKYTKLLRNSEYKALIQATGPSLVEQAESAIRVTQAMRKLKECWIDITNGPDIRVSPRRQSHATSSSDAHMWMISDDTEGEATTNKITSNKKWTSVRASQRNQTIMLMY